MGMNHGPLTALQVDEGGGAFYGPKIDLKIRDAIGRTWQCSTVQADFNLPDRFNLEYIDRFVEIFALYLPSGVTDGLRKADAKAEDCVLFPGSRPVDWIVHGPNTENVCLLVGRVANPRLRLWVGSIRRV